MKKLYQLTEDDLREEHNRMHGIFDEDDTHLFHVDELLSDEMLMAKEEYERLDRSGSLEKDEGQERRLEARSQQHYWKDKHVQEEIRARVWRSDKQNKVKLK